MLNRFGLLGKKKNPPHPVLNGQYQAGWNANQYIKLKIQAYLTLYLEFWEGTSVKSYKIQLSVLLILVLHLFLYQQISFFCNFLELHSTLYEKDFCCKLFFLNGFTQISLIAKICEAWQNFWVNFPKMPYEIFFSKICWQNLTKAPLLYQQWTATVHIF